MGGDGDIGDAGPMCVYRDVHFNYCVVLYSRYSWTASPHAANVYALVQWQNMAVQDVNNVKITKSQDHDSLNPQKLKCLWYVREMAQIECLLF